MNHCTCPDNGTAPDCIYHGTKSLRVQLADSELEIERLREEIARLLQLLHETPDL